MATKAQRKQPHRVRTALVMLLVLACLCSAGFLGYFVFQVQTVEVAGNQLFSRDQVVALSGVKVGDNLFMVQKGTIQKNFEAEPYLRLESLQRKWPSTLVLTVSERVVLSAVPYDGRYLLISEDGTILKIEDGPQEFLLINGLPITAAAQGARAQGASEYQLHVLALLYAKLQQSPCRADVKSVDAHDPAAMLLLTKQGITIRLGSEDNLDTKFQWLETLLPRLIEEGKRYGTLDLTGSAGASYIP